MSPEQIRELWSRFLSGGEISAEDQQALVDALDADPELRESLIDNLQLDGMLQAMNTTRRRGEGFVRNLTECLGAEHDATRFIEKVELRLNEPPPPPPSGGATGRHVKPPTGRAFRRRSAAPASGETAWKPALIAAAVFAAIFLLVLVSTSPVPEKGRIVRPPRKSNFEVPPPERAPSVPEVKPLPDRPRTKEEPPTPLIPPRFAEPKPEERPAPPPAVEKRSLPEPTETVKPGKTEVAPPKPEPVVVPTRVERLEGNVYLARSKSDKPRAKKNDPVPVGVDVETPGASSLAFLRFDDNTWVEVGGNSSFRETAGSNAPGGRRVFLKEGTLSSHIEKQPDGRPMVFSTPNAEAMILGTTVRLTVGHDTKLGTTLEVKEGKVLLTRLLDKKSVEVVSGQFAVAASSAADMAPQKSFPDEVLVKFGPSDVPLKPGWVLDSGEEFDAVRGYGWLGPRDGGPVPGLFWRNPGTGQLEQKRYGRFTARRTTTPGADPLKTTDVVAGWAGQSETWKMPVPNGRYLVSVCCGDVSFEQGPHHVAVEGYQLIDQKMNRAGQFVEVNDVLVEVRDGELTMIVGGNPGLRKSSDGSTDTIINYLIIKRIDTPRKK